MVEVELGGFYMMESGRVVRPTTITPEYLTLEDVADGTVWTVRRGPFEQHVAEGFVQRVRPNWEPFEPVTV